MSAEPIKILLLEDSPGDVVLFKGYLAKSTDFVIELFHACRLEEAIELQKAKQADIVMLDLSVPDSSGMQTVERFRAAHPAFPIIVLTGRGSESVGLEAVRAGAQDYLVKGQINSDSLVRSMRYAIERAKLLRQLQEALTQVKTLRGMLPICCVCKQIRDDRGYWSQVEAYISQHTDAVFTHGYCPECAAKAISSLEGRHKKTE